MLAYAHGTSTTPLLGETIGENLDRAVAAHGDREALVVRHQDVRWTYAELAERVDRVARALVAAGLERGDRMGIWAPNCAEWVLVQFASAKAGIILVNVNPAYRSSELEYVLNQSGCKLLVAATEFKTSDYRAMVAEVDAPALERTVFLGTEDWDELLSGSADLPEGLQFDDPINLQYTSGTTGFPKGATLSHHNILNNGFFVGEACGYGPEDRVCIPVPFYHCFGMVMGNLGCVTHGSCMVVPAPAFEPAATLAAVAEERCTSLYGVPTMFIAELDLPDFDAYDLTSLRTGIMAGSPCPEEVMRKVIERMHMEDVTIAYGMTETSPVSTQTGADDALELRVGTVGRVHPHVEIKIVEPETGECVRPRRAGRAVHARLLRDARILGAARQDRGGDRRRRLDAHRRPRDDGRRRLRAHRRPLQGHDHPRRRERLPARDRGVPVWARGDRRRPGRRRPRRPLRRGDRRLRRAARGRRAGRGRRPGLLLGPDRPLQGPRARALRGRVPDDGHGQGPEVQAARAAHVLTGPRVAPVVLPPFATLVDAHGDELLAHARRLTDPSTAEDVLQTALLRALRAYPRLRHADGLRAWLYRITTNTAMDHHRRARRETLVADIEVGGREDAVDGFEDLIGPLSAVNQATLRLRFVEDLEYEAIAARLDCTPEAARQRVSSALRTLRRTHAAA